MILSWGSISGNPLVASDLLSDNHVTRYGHHFGKNNCTRHKNWFWPVKLKSLATDFKVFGLRKFVGDVRLDVRRPM